MKEAQALNLGYKSIHQFARQVDEKSGIRNIFDLKTILAPMGASIVEEADIYNTSKPFIDIQKNKQFNITLPQGGNKELQRLLLSQALGHYILHSKSGSEPCYVSSISNSSASQEGFWFALSLLMPDEHFLKLVVDNYEISTLSKLFRVPEFAIQAKCKIIKKLYF